MRNVPTNICREPEGLAKTLELWISWSHKPVWRVRRLWCCGRGRVPASVRFAALRAKLKKDPDNFISQPWSIWSVYTNSDWTEGGAASVDLRPICPHGDFDLGLPGGLSRVAMQRRSADR